MKENKQQKQQQECQDFLHGKPLQIEEEKPWTFESTTKPFTINQRRITREFQQRTTQIQPRRSNKLHQNTK